MDNEEELIKIWIDFSIVPNGKVHESYETFIKEMYNLVDQERDQYPNLVWQVELPN